MATYFSINDGNFNTSSVFATSLATAAVTAGTIGNILTTSYSYPTTLATSNGATYGGVALQLSARSVTPIGTIDLILSGSDGNSTTTSFPVSGLTQYNGSNNITTTYPLGWQYFAFTNTVLISSAKTMRVGVKTSDSNQVSLIGTALTNLNRHYVTTVNGTPTTSDVVHIVGNLTNTGLIPKTVYYNVVGPITYGDFYIHNGGVLNFDHSISTTVTFAGTRGMQITPNGTVNIGTSTNPVDADEIHTINLSNSHINVHNGATLNTYGAYKTPFALLSADIPVTTNPLRFSTNISNWIGNVAFGVGDKIVITPNYTSYNTMQSTFAHSKPSDYQLQIHVATTHPHVSSTYIPSVVNLTRNVRFEGTNTTFGYIRFLDGSISNLNNTQFKGFKNTTYKGLQFCTNSTGSVSLSNCAFNGDGIATMPAFSFDSTKSPTSNVSIKGCSFFEYGATTNTITLSALSANNFIFTDNIVLSASQNGMLINGLSSTYTDIKDNFLIGNAQNGLHVVNPYVLSGAIGGIGCMNQLCGSVVAGTNNRANYDGLAGHYNNKEGVNILGTIPQLSSTTFRNLTANNNKTIGVLLSGNSNNLLSPIKVNIDGLLANNNKQAGFEGYSITGNLTGMSFDRNESNNIKISIGNANTIFDRLTSKNTSTLTKSFDNVSTLIFTTNAPLLFGEGTIFSAIEDNNKYLSVNNPELSFEKDFTIECWIRPTFSSLEMTKARRIFGFGSNVAGGLQLVLGTNDTTAANTLAVLTIDTPALITGSTNVMDGSWHHVAISRVDGIMRLFVDGVEDGESIEDTTNFNTGATNPLHIFKYAGADQGRFAGNIANFRILNSTGLYSADFTKPSQPFSMSANTTLLLNGAGHLPPFFYKFVLDSNIEVLSGRNYSATLFKDSNITGNFTNAIKLHNTKFEQFSMDFTTVSSNTEDIGSSSEVDFLQGSYNFNNCTFGTGILSSTIQNYQPEVFTENGFVVMKENEVANKHYRLLRAGKISLDETLAKSPNTISEKLEPTSLITKLRCGSKMIPVNKDQSYTVGCYVYKSVGYSGAAPRLMLKHNSALGYVDTVLDTSVGVDETWELLTGSVPAALDQGIFEVYVDCSGESGSGSVNIDNWTLDLV